VVSFTLTSPLDKSEDDGNASRIWLRRVFVNSVELWGVQSASDQAVESQGTDPTS
jgi:hypothetical protein